MTPPAELPGEGAPTLTRSARLIDAGIGVALDDYGTEYSSPVMLRDLPLRGLKLDKSFIDTIDSDPTSAILASSVISSASALGLTTTQLESLRDLGCDTARGHLVACALPAEESHAVLRAKQSDATTGPPPVPPAPAQAAFTNVDPPSPEPLTLSPDASIHWVRLPGPSPRRLFLSTDPVTIHPSAAAFCDRSVSTSAGIIGRLSAKLGSTTRIGSVL